MNKRINELEAMIEDLISKVNQTPESEKIDLFDKMILYNKEHYQLAGKYYVIYIPLERK